MAGVGLSHKPVTSGILTKEPGQLHCLFPSWCHYFFHCVCVWCSVAQLSPTLFDPMDCSPPGSSVHGVFQARILQWVALSYSRGSSLPRDLTQVSHITPLAGEFFITVPASCGTLYNSSTDVQFFKSAHVFTKLT